MKILLIIALSIGFLSSTFGQQMGDTVEETMSRELSESLAVMGIQYNLSIDETLDQTASDSKVLYKAIENLFQAIDSLKGRGQIGKFNEETIEMAKFLDTSNPMVAPIASMVLFINNKYNEAAFIMHLGITRLKLLSKVGVKIKGQQAFNMVIYYSMLPIINLYLYADMGNANYLLNKVLDYCRTNDYPPYPVKYNKIEYEEVLTNLNDHILKTSQQPDVYEEEYFQMRKIMEETINDVKERDER